MHNTRYAKTYFQPAFLICVVVLVGAKILMPVVVGVIPKKEPLPLRKPLQLLDEKGLAPYKVLAKHVIDDGDKLKSLGTEDYIEWVLEDTEAPADSTAKECLLFITYYDFADKVPHVPEECYRGGGFQLRESDSVSFEIDKEGFKGKVPGSYLIFCAADSSNWRSDTKFPVLYFFKVNGVYASSRDDARIVLNKNIFGKHSYFCKVELKFWNNRLGQEIYPNKEEAVKASEKLLGVILPTLETEHWPEWQ